MPVQTARDLAERAARALAADSRVRLVFLFGSAADADVGEAGDVDLAVWGIAPADYFEAVARVLDVGGEIKVDVVMAERCKPYLREAIEQGTEL